MRRVSRIIAKHDLSVQAPCLPGPSSPLCFRQQEGSVWASCQTALCLVSVWTLDLRWGHNVSILPWEQRHWNTVFSASMVSLPPPPLQWSLHGRLTLGLLGSSYSQGRWQNRPEGTGYPRLQPLTQGEGTPPQTSEACGHIFGFRGGRSMLWGVLSRDLWDNEAPVQKPPGWQLFLPRQFFKLFRRVVQTLALQAPQTLALQAPHASPWCFYLDVTMLTTKPPYHNLEVPARKKQKTVAYLT